MERSSPLAAMQAPCLMAPWGFHQDAALARSQFAEPARYSSNSFNFKDLSMKRPSSDYFTMKPVRGSSPTASLAADLSQNFHIDHRYVSSSAGSGEGLHADGRSLVSPKVVTPRRSLFTSTLFGTVDGRGKSDLSWPQPTRAHRPCRSHDHASLAFVFPRPRQRFHGHVSPPTQATVLGRRPEGRATCVCRTPLTHRHRLDEPPSL